MVCSACGRDGGKADTAFCGYCGAARQSAANNGAPITPPPPGPGLFAQVGERVSRVTGVGPVEGLDARELFSTVFEKRADEDIEEFFLVGTHTTTPPLRAIRAIWPKPWVFYKTFLLSLAVFMVLAVAWGQFHNPNLLPGMMVVGSFMIPFAVVVFYFEMNVPKNVSLYQVGKMITLGGVLSLLVSLFFFQMSNLSAWMGASSAGIIEECGKLAALLWIARSRRYPWTLNGLLLGGAVGAGFAGFESAGYAFRILLTEGSDSAMMQSLFMRGLLAPGGHVAWTALVGAALWRVKGERPFEFGMLQDVRFWRVLFFAMGCHMLWNSPLFGGALLFVFLKMAVLTVAVWAAILSFVQDGLKQVQAAQTAGEAAQVTPQTALPPSDNFAVAGTPAANAPVQRNEETLRP